MKIIRLLILLPLAVAVVLLSVANRQDVSFNLAPSQYVVDVPLYILLLITFFAGLVVGGIVMSVSRMKRWSKGRKQQKQMVSAPETSSMPVGKAPIKLRLSRKPIKSEDA